jgi:integrase
MGAVNLRNLAYKLRIILAELGPNLAYRITVHRMNQYVEKRLQTVKKRTNKDAPKTCIKRTTVNREICDIQAILNWAVQNGYIARNPIAGFKKPKRDDAIIQPPTIAETRALVKHAPDHLARALVLSYYTGLRPGAVELFRIRWNTVDWDEKTIFIESAKKGGRPFRIIPIHKAFFSRLRAWYKKDDTPGGLIVHYQGRPVTTIKTSWATAKRKAGITRRLRPYDFRHAFATYTLGSGADLKSTSEILGHSRSDTTSKIYQHTDLGLHRKTINKLPPLDIPDQADSNSGDS